MELHFPILIFILPLLLFLYKLYKPKTPTPPLPPGPRKLPFIGSLHHLLLGGPLPHRSLRRLSDAYGPVMHLKIGEIELVVVSSPEAAKEVMGVHDLLFASRPELVVAKVVGYGATDIAFSPYGPHWRQLRRICVLELLSSRRVKSFSYIREEEAANLVEHVRACCSRGLRSPVNMTERFSAMSNNVVSRATCGEKCRHQERLVSAIREYFRLSSGFGFAEFYPSLTFIPVVTGMKRRVAGHFWRMDGVLDEIIEEHRLLPKAADGEGGGREDLVDVLLRVKESEDLEIPLTMDNVKAVMLDMFAAGTETLANVMEWAMAEMVKNPAVMEKAQAEVRAALKLRGKERIEESDIDTLDYLKMVIKETLRLHPPAPLLLPRVCTGTCEVGGYTIAAGTRVLVNAWALGRDPKHWDDAESFRPERFSENGLDFKGSDFQYVPFGAGRRICPGVAFGVANVELALAQLLFYFDWELPGGMRPQDLDMTEAFGGSICRKLELILLARPHITA